MFLPGRDGLARINCHVAPLPAYWRYPPGKLQRMNASPNKKILLVEDEVDVVDMLTLQLRKAGGFCISVANDGA